jgi:broad specificity phosphatase PhoE
LRPSGNRLRPLGGDELSPDAAADPAAVERWAALDDEFAFPDGEEIRAFIKRIQAVAGRIAADSAETLIAFTHGGVIRLLICHFLGLKTRDYLLFGVGTASISEIRIEEGKGVLTRLNDRHHLDGFRKEAHGRA